MPRNIELKARCPDPAAAAGCALAMGARDAGVLLQVDTYFHVKSGRLKLRVIDGQRAELILYSRPNAAEIRASDYHIAQVPDPAGARALLGRSLGVLVEVRKRRRLLLWENVRIHLDDVEGLGSFLELEAVVGDAGDETVSRERAERLRDVLGVADAELIESSYSDLLLERGDGAQGQPGPTVASEAPVEGQAYGDKNDTHHGSESASPTTSMDSAVTALVALPGSAPNPAAAPP